MVRSLYAGISGLRSHQVALDVTGNNIANVNTVGFKAGRATFKESMAQMLQGPSRPAGNQGGTNPLQIGLGTSIGSIDTMLRQGNLQTTGQITDLALEGRAYFAFSSGNGTFYSRNGGLQLDAKGFLVSPTNGFRLQGKMADVNGNYGAKSVIGDIRIPWGEKAPAKATDEVSFACNLNSDSEGKGTVTHTNSFFANAATSRSVSASSASLLAGVSGIVDIDGHSLNVGDTLEFRVTGGPATVVRSLAIGESTTMEDLRAALQSELGADVKVEIGADGRFEITNNGGTAIAGLTISSTGNPPFTMTTPPISAANITNNAGTASISFGSGLTGATPLTNISGIRAGSTLTISGTSFTVGTDITTLADLAAELQDQLNAGLPATANPVSVTVSANGNLLIENTNASTIPSITITSAGGAPTTQSIAAIAPSSTVSVTLGSGLSGTDLLKDIPGFAIGDTLTFSGATLTISATTTLNQLATALQTKLDSVSSGSTVAVSATGLTITDGGSGIPAFAITSSGTGATFQKTIPTVPAQTTNVLTPGTGVTASVSTKSVNYLANMTDANGNVLNVGDTLTIGSSSLLITESTTMEDLRIALQTAIGTNGTVQLGADGRLTITAGSAAINGFPITSSGSQFSVSVPDIAAGEDATISLKNTQETRAILTNLFDEAGNSLGIKEGDVLSMTWSDSKERLDFRVDRDELTGELPTLEDLRVKVEEFLNRITGGGVKVGYGANGGFTITNNSGIAINGLRLKSDRAANSSSFITNAFEFPPSIGVDDIASTPPLRIPAYMGNKDGVGSDLLRDLFDSAGQSLGFEEGDPIDISGSVGNKNKSGGLVYTNQTSIYELLTEMQRTYGLPPTDGTIYERPTIEIKQEETNGDGIPLGAIVIRGLPETSFALTGINVRASDDNHQAPSPTRFSTNMTFVETQAARDTFVQPAPLVVYDEGGAPHNILMQFSHTGIPGEWIWEMSTLGDEEIVGGNRGRLIFGVDGTPAAFLFDDGNSKFTFEPKNGASQVSMKINWGAPGSKEGITQFDSPTTTAMKDQNGYPMGKLQEISIDEGGEITGIYTNSVTKSLAQIFVAEFNNPAGLMKVGDSMFVQSNNSGYATMQQPKVGTATKVKPGSLEMSNVELETEFTNMITIQRGYQANARVITTSDSLLQELVQLVR